jgi:AbrB family looped-hinge helix DNA binding protein
MLLRTGAQIVIPSEIRALFGVKPGDRMDFIVAEDGRMRWTKGLK